MHLFPLMIEVVAITNLTLSLNLSLWFKYLIAAISAKVTPPRKYTRIFFGLIDGAKKSASALAGGVNERPGRRLIRLTFE